MASPPVGLEDIRSQKKMECAASIVKSPMDKPIPVARLLSPWQAACLLLREGCDAYDFPAIARWSNGIRLFPEARSRVSRRYRIGTYSVCASGARGGLTSLRTWACAALVAGRAVTERTAKLILDGGRV